MIHDLCRRPGWKEFGRSEAVINLAVPWSLGSGQASLDVRVQTLRGTIAEELHHLVRARRFGEEKYEFRPDSEEEHLGTVIYYAVNEFEYEALKFCVRATGDRADLLVEVEERRRKID